MHDSNRTVIGCCILSAVLFAGAILWIGNTAARTAKDYLSGILQQQAPPPVENPLRASANDNIYGTAGRVDVNAARSLLREAYAAGDRYSGLRLCLLDISLPPRAFDWDEHSARYNDCIGEVHQMALKDEPEALQLYALSLYYSGAPEFEGQAYSYAEIAADKGLHSAELLLGILSEAGAGGSAKDLAAAEHWYGRAAEQGNLLAQGYLGSLLCRSYHSGSDPKRGLALLEDSAAAGDGISMLRLGELCEEGKVVPADGYEALGWYRRAAQAGYSEAMLRAGQMNEEGRGIEANYLEAVRWYREAAEHFSEAAVERLNALGETTMQYEWYEAQQQQEQQQP